MNDFEARFRVLEAAIQNGPATAREIENAIRVGDGTRLDAYPVLRDLADSGLVEEGLDGRWSVAA